MQPEPSEVPTTLSTERTSVDTQDQSQHGLHSDDEAVSTLPVHDAGARPTSSSSEHLALHAASAAPLQDAANADTPSSGGLRTKSTPSPPGRNRITEYEKASMPPIRKREGPGFEIIKKYRSPSDQRSPIQGLPTEVLVHAVAHLSPTDLTSVALVSKRFHDLVTGPHAWRSAFGHFFPSQDSLDKLLQDDSDETEDFVRPGRRGFTRLTALASWRSEYIIRTRLLRSLARGKPVQATPSSSSARSGQSHTATPIIMYSSQLFTTVNHLHATFGNGLNKRLPRFIHGADDLGTATSSDPNTAKTDHWGLSDLQSFMQFAERFPGDAQYGLGPGEVVGAPNVMDVSQPYGMIHGEGSPAGIVYYRSVAEMRGRCLLFSSAMSIPELGIPRILSTHEAITSIWIAKSPSIPSLTESLIGLFSGSSLGVLSAYSLGSTGGANIREQRFGRGEMTARWVLSPGVPLIAIAVDNEYSPQRYAQNRIWAIVLNALGEVFYLTKFPKRPHIDRGTKLDDENVERIAWLAGRSVHWSLIESSRRTAKPDPYADMRVDGSYSPRSSWHGMCLSLEQIKSETQEIEAFATRKPRDFQKTCFGWDMRRRLEVDFAGDDGNNAGENVVVFECGLDEDSLADVKRYTRCRFHDRPLLDVSSTPPLTLGSSAPTESTSLFGGAPSPVLGPAPTFSYDRLEESLSQDDFTGSITPKPMSEDWRNSTLSLGGLKHMQITTTTLDISLFATSTISEDPLLTISGRSTPSSPAQTPMSSTDPLVNASDIPGQRARLFSAGTTTGSIIIWNIRAPAPRSAESSSVVEPVRLIHTDSPQISCLAMSSLYLVHGGNDGLVQAWDPLGSTVLPVRTLNSRFSSRARRRLLQAQASAQGVGINLFAAGAISLDPDPTVLRGMVSLGTQLRYWSYSSSAADQYKSHKRRLRRSERSSNNGGERFSGATRSNLKDYIANEKFELDREKEQHVKEAQRVAGRYGHEMFDGSEAEMIAYAAMLSQESLEQETLRRASDTSTAVSSTDHSTWATAEATPAHSPSPRLSTPKTDEELDADMAEAIRQSLAPSPSLSAYDIPIRQAKPRGRKGSSARPSPRPSPMLAGASTVSEMNDLDFALQVSLAEEQSKLDAAEEFPTLSSPGNRGNGDEKGKGRVR